MKAIAWFVRLIFFAFVLWFALKNTTPVPLRLTSLPDPPAPPADPTPDTAPAQPFETAMGALEAIVAQLESGDLPLEQALAAFEQGVGLVRQLTARLGDAEMNSRAYCSAFNFKGSDQQKKVGLLSGGERNRVHLAKMLKEGGNLLLLDEPTNDLDTETLAAGRAEVCEAGGSELVSHGPPRACQPRGCLLCPASAATPIR